MRVRGLAGRSPTPGSADVPRPPDPPGRRGRPEDPARRRGGLGPGPRARPGDRCQAAAGPGAPANAVGCRAAARAVGRTVQIPGGALARTGQLDPPCQLRRPCGDRSRSGPAGGASRDQVAAPGSETLHKQGLQHISQGAQGDGLAMQGGQLGLGPHRAPEENFGGLHQLAPFAGFGAH